MSIFKKKYCTHLLTNFIQVSVKPKCMYVWAAWKWKKDSSHSSFDGRALQFLDYFSVSSLSVAARHIFKKKYYKKKLPFLSVSIFISLIILRLQRNLQSKKFTNKLINFKKEKKQKKRSEIKEEIVKKILC